jgi:hypothetical protein
MSMVQLQNHTDRDNLKYLREKRDPVPLSESKLGSLKYKASVPK